MQVLIAETTAADAGVDPARITLAAGRLLPGASCDRDDHTKVMFLHSVPAAESVKGRAVLPC